jgi:hypothetical protein
MKTFMLKKLAAAFALVLLTSFAGAQARTKTCGLNLEVTEAVYAEPPIQNATATAVSLKTKKKLKAVLFEGMPVFGELAAGKYTITVSKKGYRTLVKQITLDCSSLEADDPSKTEYILLRKIKTKGK